MLMPKRVKNDRRKMFRGRMKGKATQGNFIAFGDYALVAMEPAWITSRQIEAGRIAMTRHIKRGGKVWIRIFPQKTYTKKPLETRMGKGKAGVEGWVAVVKPGHVLYEMNGVAEDVAKEGMRLAMHKMPIRCKFMTRRDYAEFYAENNKMMHALAEPVVLSEEEAIEAGAPIINEEPASEVTE